MNLFVKSSGILQGPYTLAEVNQRLRDGRFKLDDLAGHQGAGVLVPLKTIPGVGTQKLIMGFEPKVFWRVLAVFIVCVIVLIYANRAPAPLSYTNPANAAFDAPLNVTTEIAKYRDAGPEERARLMEANTAELVRLKVDQYKLAGLQERKSIMRELNADLARWKRYNPSGQIDPMDDINVTIRACKAILDIGK
jgi:hypothetical protein